MMPRVFLVWLLLASTSGWLVYKLKYEVQAREAQLLELNRQIVDEQEATHVLHAEWAYLNSPDKLEQANASVTHLVPLANLQIVDISTIPFRDQTPPALPPGDAPHTMPLDDDGPTTGLPPETADRPAEQPGVANSMLMIRDRLVR